VGADGWFDVPVHGAALDNVKSAVIRLRSVLDADHGLAKRVAADAELARSPRCTLDGLDLIDEAGFLSLEMRHVDRGAPIRSGRQPLSHVVVERESQS
jgi:hypothetical protein